MRKLIAILLVAMLALVACKGGAKVAEKSAPEAPAEASVSDVDAQMDDLDSLDQELDMSDLDSLDQDLDLKDI